SCSIQWLCHQIESGGLSDWTRLDPIGESTGWSTIPEALTVSDWWHDLIPGQGPAKSSWSRAPAIAGSGRAGRRTWCLGGAGERSRAFQGWVMPEVGSEVVRLHGEVIA